MNPATTPTTGDTFFCQQMNVHCNPCVLTCCDYNMETRMDSLHFPINTMQSFRENKKKHCLLLVAFCLWHVCCCVSVCRYRAIICPVIPDPSAIFKEMIMNGNSDHKVYFRGEKKTCMAYLPAFFPHKHSLHCSFFFRPHRRNFTHRCRNPLNPAKLPLWAKTVPCSKTTDMYVWEMPALKLDNLGKFIRNIYRVIQHQEKSFVWTSGWQLGVSCTFDWCELCHTFPLLTLVAFCCDCSQMRTSTTRGQQMKIFSSFKLLCEESKM